MSEGNEHADRLAGERDGPIILYKNYKNYRLLPGSLSSNVKFIDNQENLTFSDRGGICSNSQTSWISVFTVWFRLRDYVFLNVFCFFSYLLFLGRKNLFYPLLFQRKKICYKSARKGYFANSLGLKSKLQLMPSQASAEVWTSN